MIIISIKNYKAKSWFITISRTLIKVLEASKSPESNEAIDKEKREQKLEQQLKEEYRNLSYLEAGWVTLGINTGNKKYDDLNKEYLELQLPLADNNLGIMQRITAAVEDGASALQFTWEEAQVLPDLITEYNNLKDAKNAANQSSSIEATSKMIADAAPLIKKSFFYFTF